MEIAIGFMCWACEEACCSDDGESECQVEPEPEVRKLSDIAKEIYADWGAKGKGVSPYAKPYLEAMLMLGTMDDSYYNDDAQGIVLYFLANAASWRGDVAKRVKAEFREMSK